MIFKKIEIMLNLSIIMRLKKVQFRCGLLIYIKIRKRFFEIVIKKKLKSNSYVWQSYLNILPTFLRIKLNQIQNYANIYYMLTIFKKRDTDL